MTESYNDAEIHYPLPDPRSMKSETSGVYKIGPLPVVGLPIHFPIQECWISSIEGQR